MSSFIISLISAASIFAGALLGMGLARRLPGHPAKACENRRVFKSWNLELVQRSAVCSNSTHDIHPKR
jgi:uncharacterized membrane protein YdjX (TVP38/TMEM64 family)